MNRLIKQSATGALLLSALFTPSAYAEVTDPAAATPPLHYESAFADYRAQQDTPLRPWTNLFTAEGDFAVTATPAARAQVTADKVIPAQKSAQTAVATTSDTRGHIESINTSEGKVKLKHGPIPKFDMPGMTMVFRVQDPKLLTQIKVGDEVGVTIEEIGNGFVITGFQK